jgi:ribosome biogenesis GTPase
VAVDLPCDGEAVVHALLPRRGKFSRRAVGGEALEQIVAANVDVALIVAALNFDFNLRRLERYVATVWDGGATPVVVLSKADLAANLDARVAEAMAVAPGCDVVPLCSFSGPDDEATDDGLPVRPAMATRVDPAWAPELALAHVLKPGKTLALMGSSGAGKSTLANRLLGEARQLTQDVREGDSRGRHTTTWRELVVAPSGVIVIDTPGMRELGRWEAGSGLDRLFADIAEVAGRCRFSDCAHDGEPGCAIAAGLADGSLDAGRVEGWRKLVREEAYQVRRVDQRALLAEKAKWKAIQKEVRGRIR